MVLGYGFSFFTTFDLDALCAFPGGRLHPIKQGKDGIFDRRFFRAPRRGKLLLTRQGGLESTKGA
jgi:hypothetical protein